MPLDEEGNAGVGDDAELRDRQVPRELAVRARVADDERRARADDVLTEGVGERGLAPRGPGLDEADGALEELPLLVHERDQRDRRVEQAGGEAGQPIERGLLRGVEEACRAQDVEALAG